MIKEAAQWISLAHLPRWRSSRINELIVKFYIDNKISVEDFFLLNEKEWRNEYDLNDKEISDLIKAKSEIPNNSFLAESLYNQGFELIPIISEEYSRTLKDNLKLRYSPALLYIKGDKQIFNEKSVAIVGSRNASEKSLEFTDRISNIVSKEFKVIVSGFAKGVDKQALDSAIKYLGRSIIVLPQGVLTFGAGYKTYYSQIVNGDVLVLSTFHPNAPWKVELAMARNPIIYGLANEIFVAESDEKGGTWSGVIDGLKKGRIIYVRKSDKTENNSNNKLIQLGATAIDFDGKIKPNAQAIIDKENILEVKDSKLSFDDTIKNLLTNKSLTSKELLLKLKLDWSSIKLSNYLKKLDFIEIIKIKGVNLFRIKGQTENEQIGLF